MELLRFYYSASSNRGLPVSEILLEILNACNRLLATVATRSPPVWCGRKPPKYRAATTSLWSK